MSKVWAILKKENGQIANKKVIRFLFEQLKDGKYQVEVFPHDKRSNPQNNYYWQMLSLYVQPALYNEGWQQIKTKEDAHVFVADLFLKVKMINETTGEVRERTKSTTELSKEEFNIYLSEIWQWAAEYLSTTIPAPNEQTILSYGD